MSAASLYGGNATDFPEDIVPPIWVARTSPWLSGWYAGWLFVTVSLMFASANMVHHFSSRGLKSDLVVYTFAFLSLASWAIFQFMVYSPFALDATYNTKVLFSFVATTNYLCACGFANQVWIDQFARTTKFVLKTDTFTYGWKALNLVVIAALYCVTLATSVIFLFKEEVVPDSTDVMRAFYAVYALAFLLFTVAPLINVHFLLDRDRLKTWKKVSRHTFAGVYVPAFLVAESFIFQMWVAGVGYEKGGLRDPLDSQIIRNVLHVHDTAMIPLGMGILIALVYYALLVKAEFFAGILDVNVVVTPMKLEFGQVNVHSGSAVGEVVITNEGTSDLTIHEVKIVDKMGKAIKPKRAVFSISSDTKETAIGKGKRRTIEITFDPRKTGLSKAFLLVHTADADSPRTLVALTGQGIEADIEFSPSFVDLGQQSVRKGAGGRSYITISNKGNAPLEIDSVFIQNPESVFSIVSDTGEEVLEGGEERKVLVTFDPDTRGFVTDYLVVRSSDADEAEVKLTLKGEGLDGEVDISPMDFDFGSQPVAEGDSAGQTLVVQNLGTLDLNIKRVKLESEEHFQIVEDTGESVLAPGRKRLVRIAFDPAAPGPVSTNVVVVSDDQDEGVTVVPIRGSGTQGELSATPTAADFGGVAVEGSEETTTIYLSNEGDAALKLKSVSVQGKHKNEFAITEDSGEVVLEPGDMRTLEVTFDPKAKGVRQAFVAAKSDSGEIRVGLTGKGLEGEIVVSPSVLQFDELELEDDAEEELVITNEGSQALALETVELVGGEHHDLFEIVDDTGEDELEPGDSRTITVAFKAPEEAAQSILANTFLRIRSDDPDDSNLEIPIRGKVFVPPPPPFEDVGDINNTVFCIDASGSMNKKNRDGEKRIDVVTSRLSEIIVDADEDAKIGLVCFQGKKVMPFRKKLVELTEDTKEEMIEWLKNVQAKQKTPTLKAMKFCFDQYKSMSRLILLTDGTATDSKTPEQKKAVRAWKAKRRGPAVVDTVALMIGGKDTPKQREKIHQQMQAIANAGGGKCDAIIE